MINKTFLLVLFFFFSLIPLSFSALLKADPLNSTILFRINHNQGYTIGYFKDFVATLDVSEDQTKLQGANASVKIGSIDTKNVLRDEGLKSSMFFDEGQFPEAKFESTGIEGDQMSGSLTIKGITKPMTLKVSLNQDSGKVFLTARGTFNRNDYGIKYNKELGRHQKAIGDMVDLIIELRSAP